MNVKGKTPVKKGIDITNEPIPIVPAAHYNCGGVGVNLVGKTSLKRLYAVGELTPACTPIVKPYILTQPLQEKTSLGFREETLYYLKT